MAKVLVIGSGGREHALVWKLKQSPSVQSIYCSPGNGGIAMDASILPPGTDLPRFSKDHRIDLVVIGPEQPLVEGMTDKFEKAGMLVFGPSQKAAQLEGSKIYAKKIMKKYHIPTADFEMFSDYSAASENICSAQYPLVIKADGLAAGKGVCVAKDINEAGEFLKNVMVDKTFGPAGEQVIIEECLIGEELSILALCDGERFVLLPASQDHKRIFDDDQGPNTGGMGAYSPLAWMDDKLKKQISDNVIGPMLKGMTQEGAPYKGVLYAGLMMTSDGLKVLEFNVRFGDPETQAVLPLLNDDLFELMRQCAQGNLISQKLSIKKGASVCVVMASQGYPGRYDKNFRIDGLDFLKNTDDTYCFHAGTVSLDEGIYTHAGRVLGITAIGEDLEQAIDRVYMSVKRVKFKNSYYRKDIGRKGLHLIK